MHRFGESLHGHGFEWRVNHKMWYLITKAVEEPNSETVLSNLCIDHVFRQESTKPPRRERIV